jgi:hypothetical protein
LLNQLLATVTSPATPSNNSWEKSFKLLNAVFVFVGWGWGVWKGGELEASLSGFEVGKLCDGSEEKKSWVEEECV